MQRRQNGKTPPERGSNLKAIDLAHGAVKRAPWRAAPLAPLYRKFQGFELGQPVTDAESLMIYIKTISYCSWLKFDSTCNDTGLPMKSISIARCCDSSSRKRSITCC